MFERKQREFLEVIEKAVKGGMEYVDANSCNGKNDKVEKADVRWKAPVEGMYKLNTDVAILGGNLIV